MNNPAKKETKPKYITVTKGMSGHFAVMMWWNDRDSEQGFWEPWETGMGRFQTREEAVAEAKWWAKDEELELRV